MAPGRPLTLLRGAYTTVAAMGEIVPELVKTRQVIAVELQSPGRTADVHRPLSYEPLAEDIAALSRHLGIEAAALFGCSMGAVRLASGAHGLRILRLEQATGGAAGDQCRVLVRGLADDVAAVREEPNWTSALETGH
jgi:pimeloyl-ACP methyl ester carboxylesterase